jgi:Putative auto-transporter adhesin, head GIN domain
MKKLFLSFLVAAITTGAVFAQKNINDPNAEKRTVSGFHGIEVSTGIELTITEGNTEEVAVSAATTEWSDKIVTKVENGILKIYYENKLNAINSKKEKKELKAWVSYKSLDRLDANTGAQVEIEGTLKAASMKMNVNTGATVKGLVNIDDLNVDQNTGSVVTLSGNAGKLDVNGDTGSMFKGIDLETSNCNAKVSTGAGIYITVQKELYIKANTGGYVKYKGDAGIREIKTNTGGSVSKI